MTQNMSNIDRALRTAAGFILIALAMGFHDAGNAPESAIWWGWIGVVPLATAFFGWCPLYGFLGISTYTRS